MKPYESETRVADRDPVMISEKEAAESLGTTVAALRSSGSVGPPWGVGDQGGWQVGLPCGRIVRMVGASTPGCTSTDSPMRERNHMTVELLTDAGNPHSDASTREGTRVELLRAWAE